MSERQRLPKPIAYATPMTDAPVLMGDLPSPGWRAAVGAAWMAGVLVAAYVAGAWMYDQQQDLVDRIAIGRGLVGAGWSMIWTVPAAFAFPVVFGSVAAITLYDWRRQRLAWVLAVPVLAGGASLVAVSATGSFGDGWFHAAAATATQCGLAYGGTWVGRPVARWLARRLVPPPLRAATVALWV